VLEQIDGLELETFLLQKSQEVASGECRYKVLSDVSCALRYLHSRRPLIVHSDLKASNIILERGASGMRAKLCDFGLSRLITRSSRLVGGTLCYMAPEIICDSRIPSPPVDVFSFGRLIYFVSTSTPPYAHLTRKSFISSARLGSFPPLVWPPESWALEDCKSLSQHCLCFDPDLRPTMETVYGTLDQTWTEWHSQTGTMGDRSSIRPLSQAADYIRASFASRVGKLRKNTSVGKLRKNTSVLEDGASKVKVMAPKDVNSNKLCRHPSISTTPSEKSSRKENPLQWLGTVVVGLDASSSEMPIRTCDFCFTAVETMPDHVSVCLARYLSQWMAQTEFERLRSTLDSLNINKLPAHRRDVGLVVLSSALLSRDQTRAIVAKEVYVTLQEEDPSHSPGKSSSPLLMTFKDFAWVEPSQDEQLLLSDFDPSTNFRVTL